MKKLGDRKDGIKLRKIHSMHFVMPLIFPNRCDNEAFISERIDLTNVNAYLAKKNADNPEYAYNLFQVIVTAVLWYFRTKPLYRNFAGATAAIVCSVMSPFFMASPMAFMVIHFYNDEKSTNSRKLNYLAYPVILTVAAAVGLFL